MTALWLKPDPLVLASKSASRAELLRAAGLPFDVVPADVDERGLERAHGAIDAQQAAGILARAKALAISTRLPGRLVLGADQTLSFAGGRLSKPVDIDNARHQLRALRGRSHRLHAALAIAREGRILWQDGRSAELTMRDFSDAFLEGYLDIAGEAVMSSVGGYQLEGPGVHLFARIDGDHSTILGLPLMPLLAALRSLGVLAT